MKLRRRLAVLLAAALLAGLVGAWAGLTAPARADYDMPYVIEVDISSQIVTIYDAQTRQIVRQMLCSTGRNDQTPTGDFVLPGNSKKTDRQPWYYIASFHRYVRYPTRIRGEFLFHSLPYTRKSLQSIERLAADQFGTPASHGCVRLRWQDAEFIALNCLPGTRLRILKSGDRKDGLRELLYQGAYDASQGLSYDSFMGVSTEEGTLGRFSEGREVLDLQYRLRDLGLYDGELSGVYDSATVNAVRMAQYLLGEDMSGVASEELRARLMGGDPPTAMNVSLSEGMSGPAVRALQDNLAALRLYEDDPDSVYDAAVVAAVTRFQQVYCYEPNGVASPELQKAVAFEAARLAETFPAGDYSLSLEGESLTLARVSAKAGMSLRVAASQKSRQLRKLAMGEVLVVLQKGDEWSRVRTDGEEGYVYSPLVRFYDWQSAMLKYAAEGDDAVYVVGSSPEDYLDGARLPCDVFAEYLAANDQQVDVSRLANFATVDTGDDATALNLREAPDADSTVLDRVANGERLRVQRRQAEWTRVIYNGREGYLMNRYLSFWTGPDDALDASLDGEEVDLSRVLYAVVESAVEDSAPVYEADLDDARVLGRLKNGTRVDVVDMGAGWCRISYRDHEGYMIAETLHLVMEGDDAPA